MIELQTDVPVPTGFDGPVPPDDRLVVAVETAEGEPDRPVAVLVARLERAVATVDRVWIADGAVGRVEADLLDALVARYRAAGAGVLLVNVADGQTELARQLQDAPVTDLHMVKPVPNDVPDLPAGYGSRPMTPAEYRRWEAAQVEAYARENLPRLGGDIELARERSRRSLGELLPQGLDTVDTAIVILTSNDERVGVLWLRHHWTTGRDGTAGAQSFIFDVEIDAAHRGAGFGRAALAVAVRATHAAGDPELGLHVFGHNTVARALYVSDGFETVETTYNALGG